MGRLLGCLGFGPGGGGGNLSDLVCNTGNSNMK